MTSSGKKPNNKAARNRKKNKRKARIVSAESSSRPKQLREPDCCRRLEKRVAALELSRAEGMPKALMPSALHLAAVAQPGVMVFGATGAMSSTFDVKLDKAAGSPNLVRITQDNDPSVVFMAPGRADGKIPGAPVGSFIVIKIEVTGNFQDTVTIKVTGAVPSSIVIAVPASGQIVESQSLLVTG